MDSDRKPLPMAKSADDKVHCPRIGRDQSVDEHMSCPYCYGKEKQVSEGDRARFCDFHPGEDPINFGFPPDSSRLNEG